MLENPPQKLAFIKPLNALRFFAALSVVIFHYGKLSTPATLGFIKPYISVSNLAVTFFFVLSGFIMVHVYHHLKTFQWDTLKTFYQARVSRIIPLYLLALLLVASYLLFSNTPIPLKQLLSHALFLQAWIPEHALTLNFTDWSLSAEMFFYILFPFIIPFFAKLSWKKQLLTTITIWITGTIVTLLFALSYPENGSTTIAFIKHLPLLHISSFLVGMLGGFWHKKHPQFPAWLFYVTIAALVLYPWLGYVKRSIIHHNGLASPLFILLILGISSNSILPTLHSFLSRKIFLILGEASYGIYLLQVPVYMWVYAAYNKSNLYPVLSETQRFWIYALILILVSLVLRYTFEDKTKKLLRHRI